MEVRMRVLLAIPPPHCPSRLAAFRRVTGGVVRGVVFATTVAPFAALSEEIPISVRIMGTFSSPSH